MNLTAEMVGATLVIKIPVPAAPPPPADDLVDLASCGLETKAATRLRKAGKLACVRIGRRWYTTRAALVALVPAAAPMSTPADGPRPVRAPGRRRAAKQNPEGC